MNKEICSGVEINPTAFITRGWIPASYGAGVCQWIRVGRMRLGRYGPGVIRPSLATYSTGFQFTVWRFFLSWTYRHSFTPAPRS